MVGTLALPARPDQPGPPPGPAREMNYEAAPGGDSTTGFTSDVDRRAACCIALGQFGSPSAGS